jgi:hypothetical protein
VSHGIDVSEPHGEVGNDFLVLLHLSLPLCRLHGAFRFIQSAQVKVKQGENIRPCKPFLIISCSKGDDMSKHMQIDIRLLSFYERGFKTHFPKLAKAMESSGYKDAVDEERSLYDLVDVLRSMGNDKKAPDSLKDILKPFVGKLVPLKEAAREELLARRLNSLDRLLYTMEDDFEALEKAIKGWAPEEDS